MKEKHRKNVLLCNGDGLAAEAGLIRLLRPAAPVLWGKPLLFPFTFLDADGLKVSGVEDKEPAKVLLKS